MGFFDKMKQAVGIGGAKVEVQLNPGPVTLGGFAKGRVVLRGGKSDQKCNFMVVELKRITTVRKEVQGKMMDVDESDTLQTQRVADYAFDITAGSEQSWEFALKVPREGGAGSKIRYKVWGSADIPGAIDPSHTVDIPVTEAAQVSAADVPELLATAQTLRSQSGDNGPQVEGLLKQVLGFEPQNTQALRLLAEQVGYRNDAEAVPHWKAYLKVVPSDVEAWEELGRNAERRSAYPEALEQFGQALSLAPNRSYLHAQRARVLEQLNKFDDAVKAYDAALTGDSPDASHGIARAKALHKLGRTADAEAALVKLGEDGDKWRLQELLETLGEFGITRHEDALISRALQVNQDDPYRVHEVKGHRLLKQGKYEAAIAAFDQAMKGSNLGEWNLSALMSARGQALEHLQRTDDAKLAYKKALEINKDNYEAKTRLKAL